MPLKLNGWQRLWIVAVVMWLLPVIAFSYELWPTTADVLKAEVYAQLKPDDRDRLAPLAPVGELTPYTPPEATDKWSRYIVPVAPVGKLSRTAEELAGEIASGALVCATLDNHAVGLAEFTPQELARLFMAGTIVCIPPPVKKPSGPIVDIDGHEVPTLDMSKSIPVRLVAEGHQIDFLHGVPPEKIDQITRTYALILHHILIIKRAAFTVKMFGFWTVPMIGLYLMGWAIAWVRRGFRQVA